MSMERAFGRSHIQVLCYLYENKDHFRSGETIAIFMLITTLRKHSLIPRLRTSFSPRCFPREHSLLKSIARFYNEISYYDSYFRSCSQSLSYHKIPLLIYLLLVHCLVCTMLPLMGLICLLLTSIP